MTGSSLLVVGEGEVGVVWWGCLVARVEECALDAECLVECFCRVGGGIGGVLGGGKAGFATAEVGKVAVVSEWVSSRGLSVWWTSSSLTSWRSGTSGLAAGNEYGSLWSSSSTEGLGTQSGESWSTGMARSRAGGESRAGAQTAAANRKHDDTENGCYQKKLMKSEM